MIYKRATARLRAAGITTINIEKRLHGATPHLIGVRRQTSRCFKTPDEAADAVLAGYRPVDDTAPKNDREAQDAREQDADDIADSRSY